VTPFSSYSRRLSLSDGKQRCATPRMTADVDRFVPTETFISLTFFSVFVCENDVQTSILNGKLSRGLGLPIASGGNG